MKEILITSTVLILFILLIRRVFHGKISTRLQYALWLLVALRLVIPVSAQLDLGILSKLRPTSLVGQIEHERGDVVKRLEEPIQMAVDSGSVLFRLGLIGSEAQKKEMEEMMQDMSADGPTSVFMAGTLGFSRLDVLWFLWGIGALIVGVWILATNIMFSRRLKKTRQPFVLPEEVKAAVLGDEAADAAGCEEAPAGEGKGGHIFGKKGKLPAVYLAEGISSPCLYGFPGREAVYLTADVSDDADRLRHVVVHELVHKKHGDSFWALLRGVLVTVYWFHPLVWVSAACSKRDCELSCDEGALALLGEEERISYGETLLSIITSKGRVSDLVCTATTMTGSGKSVKERIRFIAKAPKVFYAAVAGALLLIAAVCLFVFTKDAGFNGIVVNAQEGLTVTGADMQIPLPASIGGISGCVVEKESDDVVIYHIATQEEVGRFAKMPLKDVLQLVDDGREVVPIGDQGTNYLLRAYLGEPLSWTEHTYTPAREMGTEDSIDYLPHETITEEPIDESRSGTEHTYTPAGEDGGAAGVPGTDSNEGSEPVVIDDDTTYILDEEEAVPENGKNPLLSKDWEVIPLEEDEGEANTDYLPNEKIAETITTEPIDESRSVTEHTYTPAGEEGTDEAAGQENVEKIGGMLGHTDIYIEDDTTYILDEGEAGTNYLPNEEIVTVSYQPREVNVDEIDNRCYVYIKADFYGKVNETYQEEIAFIDRELKAAAGDIIVLSLNKKRREALFDALTENRTPYVGDNSKVGAMLSAIPIPPTLIREEGFTLQTAEEPYSLRFDYNMSTGLFTKEDQEMLYFNAAMLFYSIGNVDEIAMEVKDQNPSYGSIMVAYSREELEKELPLLAQGADFEDAQAFRDGLTKLHLAVEEKLSGAALE